MPLPPPPTDDTSIEFRWRQWLHEVYKEVQLPTTSFALEASLGNVAGYATVNKFGHAPDCDSGIPTDVWDGADGVTSTDLWVPPTQARVHQLSSNNAADTGAGAGMRTVRVTYLPDWDTAEQTVDLTMNGTGNVATPACVMIHRVKGLTWGSSGTNVGVITATADVDLTITAAIQPGEGQTQMCIYGIPSTQKFRMTHAQCEIIKAGGAAVIWEGNIEFMPDPAINAANSAWVNKEHLSHTSGTNPWEHRYEVPKKFDGPGIIKITGSASANNQQVTAGFEGYLVDG